MRFQKKGHTPPVEAGPPEITSAERGRIKSYLKAQLDGPLTLQGVADLLHASPAGTLSAAGKAKLTGARIEEILAEMVREGDLERA